MGPTALLPICDASLTGFLPEDRGPYALTPNTVELIPTLGALFPRGGPVKDSVLHGPVAEPAAGLERIGAHAGY